MLMLLIWFFLCVVCFSVCRFVLVVNVRLLLRVMVVFSNEVSMCFIWCFFV